MARFGTMIALSITLIASSLIVLASGADIGTMCLPGDRHKTKPGPEGPEYKTCHVFKNSSCCTANFTNQLAVPVVQKIDNFSWNLCGNLSKKCQFFMVEVECFYSCSPYVAHWQDKNEKQAFNNAPVCSDYCDKWFAACKDDLTCAKNWLKDFDVASDWSNTCKSNKPCLTSKDYYRNGADLCENIWDDSFKYTRPEDGPCLQFSFSGPTNPNKEVVAKIFGNSVSRTQANLSLALITSILLVMLS